MEASYATDATVHALIPIINLWMPGTFGCTTDSIGLLSSTQGIGAIASADLFL